MSEEKAPEGVEIFVKPHGSYHVTGRVTIIDEYGDKIVKEGIFSLCRCGASEHKPFCDDKHREGVYSKNDLRLCRKTCQLNVSLTMVR